MNNIRTFDIVLVTNENGILGQKGGNCHKGRWYVLSEHNTYLVISRGCRTMRVRTDAVTVVGHHEMSATVSEDALIDVDDIQ